MQSVQLCFENSTRILHGVITDRFVTYQTASRATHVAVVKYENSQGLPREAYMNLATGTEMQYNERRKLINVKGLNIVNLADIQEK